ncbi:ureidoglycolate lyase [Shinella sp. CPCC 101442]|uniref:ureidoglycolate lyase n=1 Tax=Shinella sp. CPCC 101442 TaxID=2932265 RepID=UPI002152C6D2|nr:ureidoglycolate lyase [Shinella sp. CPCC 101442]MCR6498238.1 ureidoglycolate lyase [Shinella sp. CPCC 101442]
MSADAIVARPVAAGNFARYGKVYDLAGDTDRDVIRTNGDGWQDGFTRTPLIDGSGHLGMTRGGSAPWSCTAMERHPQTEEAIFCAAEPVVLAVAPASTADAPHRDEIEAFVIAPGQAVVMHRNVWHDACRGATRPAAYYWMAICGLGESPWIPVAGGPRQVRTTDGPSA